MGKSELSRTQRAIQRERRTVITVVSLTSRELDAYETPGSTWSRSCPVSTISDVNYRSWYLIVGLIIGAPVLAIMGPIGVLVGVAGIVAWLMDQRKRRSG